MSKHNSISTGPSPAPPTLKTGQASPERLLAELSRVAEILRASVRQDIATLPLTAVVRLVPGLDMGNWQEMAARNRCEGWFALDLHTSGSDAQGSPGKTSVKKDPITAMLDADAFDKKLTLEVARAHKNRRPLALVLFELEGLKTLPKAEAESQLRVVSSRLWESAQLDDKLGRVSEEMLAMLLPGSGHFHALALAESVVNDAWNHCNILELSPFTLRASVAALDLDSAMDGNELMENARQALALAVSAPALSIRDRVKLYRKDDNVAERETLVMANEKQFLFFGGA